MIFMNNINLNLFKYFYYVAYYHGFTNASKKLNVAQSALSYNIKVLEDLINKKLIIRNSKKFQLTEEGYSLYENLKSVFFLLEGSINNIYDNNSKYLELTIGVRHYLSDFIFKNAIKEFNEQNPNVHLNIVLYSFLDVDKFKNDFDILIDYTEYLNLLDDINRCHLCDLENVIVCGNKTQEIYTDINSIKELTEFKFILPCPNRKNGKIQKMCYENGILFNNLISLNDSCLCKKLVKDDIALSILPKESIKEELDSKILHEIKIAENIFIDTVEIAYKKVGQNKMAERFINTLLKEYNGGK